MRIVLTVVVSLVGFGGGFVGVYLAMPDPAATEMVVDSTGAVLVDTIAIDSFAISPLSPDLVFLDKDSLLAGPDSLAAASLYAEIDTLVDSLNMARSKLEEAESAITQLESRITQLTTEATARTSRREVAAGMATTLPKLDLKELGPILGALGDASLLDLYEAASSRNRPIILQALTSDRAALLVQQFMNPDVEDTPAQIVSMDI